jgi:DNA-directed RNA polymerase subunit RPC12/RpoP
MAILLAANMRCKNKLCDYEGIERYYDRGEPSLVCPKCGFKTLTRFHPMLEKLARELKGG